MEFDGVSWALCHERTPFVEMLLTGISLTNLRNRDQSGGCNCSSNAWLPCICAKDCWRVGNWKVLCYYLSHLSLRSHP